MYHLYFETKCCHARVIFSYKMFFLSISAAMKFQILDLSIVLLTQYPPVLPFKRVLLILHLLD